MADDERNAEVAGWLEVEPLDDLTRRRLVSSALRETDAADVDAPARPSRTWRWLAAAAVVVVLLVGGLALLSTGGDDTPTASREDRTTALAPKSSAAAVAADVGDFGNLDDPANLAALRTALGQSFAGSSVAPQAAGDASTSERSAAGTTADGGAPLALCGAIVPEGATIVAQGTGTIEGRRATVVLIETADGTRSSDAVLEDPCELRHLP